MSMKKPININGLITSKEYRENTSDKKKRHRITYFPEWKNEKRKSWFKKKGI